MTNFHVFERWKSENSVIRLEFVGGNISVTFTGCILYLSWSELRLGKLDDEVSISLSNVRMNYFEKVDGSVESQSFFQQNFFSAVRLDTRTGIICMLYELRNPLMKKASGYYGTPPDITMRTTQISLPTEKIKSNLPSNLKK